MRLALTVLPLSSTKVAPEGVELTVSQTGWSLYCPLE
jgi:hypothetical protein